MKKMIILSLFLFSTPQEAFCTGGHAEGNGGDTERQEKVREFFEITDWVIQDIDTWAKEFWPEGSLDVILRAESPKDLKVYPVDSALTILDVNGVEREVDAKNYPSENKIEFNIPKWDSKSTLEKKALVHHEFCGLADIERNHFGTSAQYKEQLIERDAVTETEFRKPLRKYVMDLGNAILNLFEPETEANIHYIEAIRNSDLYKTATDAYPKAWYEFSSVTEDEQILATRDVSKKMSKMKVLGDTSGKNELIRQKDKMLQDWQQTLKKYRQGDQAFTLQCELMNAKFQYAAELSLFHANQLKTIVNTCFEFPLGQSVECVMEKWINYVSVLLPSETAKRKKAVKDMLKKMNQEINNYYEQ